MQLNKTFALAFLFVVAGCSYEEGFEYQTTTTLMPTNASGVKGTIVMGYGIQTSSKSRLRISASGLSRNMAYEVRFFDVKGCEYTGLVNAKRIDGKSNDPNRAKEAWGFDGGQIIVADNLRGSVEKEFTLTPPRAPSLYLDGPERYPTVVIFASETGQNVACGTILSRPENKRPHM